MNDNVTISTYELLKMFPDAEAARLFIERQRWNGHVVCPLCGCDGNITARKGKRLGYYRCRDCGGEFTVRTGAIFERSHVPLGKWLLAMYLVVTSRKGISSMQLSKELWITQQTAWFLLGRLRVCLGKDPGVKLRGIVEIDEAFIGGKEGNKHAHKRLSVGGGVGGKQAVIGLRERKTGKSVAFPIPDTTRETLHGAIRAHVEPGSEIHTDEATGYANLPGYIREHVKHSAGEYVGANDVTVNAVESMWAVLKRGIYGIWHQVSVKDLRRYVDEATFRLNDANVRVPTMARLEAFVALAFRCRITYKKFIA